MIAVRKEAEVNRSSWSEEKTNPQHKITQSVTERDGLSIENEHLRNEKCRTREGNTRTRWHNYVAFYFSEPNDEEEGGRKRQRKENSEYQSAVPLMLSLLSFFNEAEEEVQSYEVLGEQLTRCIPCNQVYKWEPKSYQHIRHLKTKKHRSNS